MEGARNLAVGLGGTTIAILTFTLFFLFPQDKSGQINHILFHATLGVAILALFGFGFATFYYSRLMTDIVRQDPRDLRHLRMGNLCLQGGLALFSLVPALVLFTIAIYEIAILALGLWLLLLIAVIRSRKDYEPAMM